MPRQNVNIVDVCKTRAAPIEDARALIASGGYKWFCRSIKAKRLSNKPHVISSGLMYFFFQHLVLNIASSIAECIQKKYKKILENSNGKSCGWKNILPICR